MSFLPARLSIFRVSALFGSCPGASSVLTTSHLRCDELLSVSRLAPVAPLEPHAALCPRLLPSIGCFVPGLLVCLLATAAPCL